MSTIFTEGFVPVITAGLYVRAACLSVVWLFLRQLCPVIGQTHIAASLRPLSLSPTLPLIPPGIAVRGMALCLGMQHAISLAHPLVVGLRDGIVPTGAPPIIVVVHSLDAWGAAFPPVQWKPEVHLRWPPYVTQIHTMHSLYNDSESLLSA